MPAFYRLVLLALGLDGAQARPPRWWMGARRPLWGFHQDNAAEGAVDQLSLGEGKL